MAHAVLRAQLCLPEWWYAMRRANLNAYEGQACVTWHVSVGRHVLGDPYEACFVNLWGGHVTPGQCQAFCSMEGLAGLHQSTSVQVTAVQLANIYISRGLKAGDQGHQDNI